VAVLMQRGLLLVLLQRITA